MRCPKCGSSEDKVVDSREAREGHAIRRRRECQRCEFRFTTYEIVEREELRVVKRNGSRVPFDRDKLLGGIRKACEKRPVTLEALEQVVDEIADELEQRRHLLSALELSPRPETAARVRQQLAEIDALQKRRVGRLHSPPGWS